SEQISSLLFIFVACELNLDARTRWVGGGVRMSLRSDIKNQGRMRCRRIEFIVMKYSKRHSLGMRWHTGCYNSGHCTHLRTHITLYNNCPCTDCRREAASAP